MSEEIVFKDDGDLSNWLELQAPSVSAEIPYILAHADDGVIWGRFDNGKLITANEVFIKPDFDFPQLRLSTLQQCRVFGKKGQVLLWKYNGEKWKWHFIEDLADEKIEERQILWGTHGERRGKFTLLWDGSQGLKHAVPLSIITGGDRKLDKPVRLVVYHYIKYNEDDLARIVLSRLVDLTTQEKDNEKNDTKK